MMGNNVHFFRQSSGGGLFPLQLTPVVYINASQGVNLDSNGRVDTVDDLSGNGYNFESVFISNNVGYEPNGINNLPSFEFNNDSYLKNEDTITQITDLSQRFIWCVFQITDVNSGQNYHNIFIIGTGSSSSSGSIYAQLANNNNTNDFTAYYNTVSLRDIISDPQLTPKYAIIDKTSSQIEYTLNGVSSVKSGIQSVRNKNIYLGFAPMFSSFAGGKMLISEFGILNYTPTPQQIQDLKDYFTNTYNL